MIPYLSKGKKAECGFPTFRTANQNIIIEKALKFLSDDPFTLDYELKKHNGIEYVISKFQCSNYDFIVAYRVENDRLIVERIGTNLF